ncbi:response regulator transcription factor [Microaceticoccus formicicus]|uniref:response regulator transcription factor n=1 Tax=Microaceticoccus formicicus TaxID=3118105 RepID=UPI003CD00923|nr:response regulator transcription factor [Peptoniphilaceae bacterium AMB_02]
MSLNIILVNPDEVYTEELIYSFETENYQITKAVTVKEAIEKIKKHDYDLALIDMIFSDGTGLDLKKQMNEIKNIPTIVVTKVSEDIQKVLALEYGADDYIVRPFNILELKARIRSVLRRVGESKKREEEAKLKAQVIESGDFEFNIVGRKVRLRGEDIDLTGKEFDLLFILALNPGQIFSREQLAEKIWGEDYEGHLRTVDVHIRRLREKIENEEDVEQYIQTKWGEGYYFGDEISQ